MNNRIKSLALLVNLGIYGGCFSVKRSGKPPPTIKTAPLKRPYGGHRRRAEPAGAGRLRTITADEIRKRPPARDVSEIIRTMPGVNLTGNSTSGQRGNNRQD